MQTLKQFRLSQQANGRLVSEAWLRKLCHRWLFPGAQFVAGRVWMLPDDAAYPAGLVPGRKAGK